MNRVILGALFIFILVYGAHLLKLEQECAVVHGVVVRTLWFYTCLDPRPLK